MPTRRTYVIVAALVLVTVVVIAAVYAYTVLPGLQIQQQEDLAFRTTYNAAMSFEFDTFDIQKAVSGIPSGVMGHCYEGLLTYENLTLQPKLATSWTVSPDAKIYTFTLRQGVKFHDGTPFNASAVVYNYQRCKNYTSGSGYRYAKLIQTIEIIDNYNVKITLTGPAANMLTGWFAAMEGTASNMMSPSYIMAHGENSLQWAECGTGPYKLVEWMSDVRATLVKFDDYWGGWDAPAPGQMHIEKINLLVVKESSSQRMLVQSGEVDFAEKIISEDWATLNATEGVLLTVQAKGLYPNPICFDMTEAPFNDSRVRLAVAYAMDYDKLLQVLPYSSRVYQFLPVPQYGTAPNITQYSMNITKAKELMTAAGYGNLLQGQTMHLVCVGFDARPDQKKMYEVLKASILAIGFDLEIKMLTGSLALASWTQTQNWDIACNRCGAFVDPDTLAQYTNSTSGLFNVPHYNNSRVDYLETLARATGDMATRLTYYYEVETILSNEIPWLPMMDYPMVSCQRAWLKNAQFRGLYTYCPINIYEVWKQK